MDALILQLADELQRAEQHPTLHVRPVAEQEYLQCIFTPLHESATVAANQQWINHSDLLAAYAILVQSEDEEYDASQAVTTMQASLGQYLAVAEIHSYVESWVGPFSLQLYLRQLHSDIRSPSVITFIILSCVYKIRFEFVTHWREVSSDVIAQRYYAPLDFHAEWVKSNMIHHGVYGRDLFYAEAPRFANSEPDLQHSAVFCIGSFIFPYPAPHACERRGQAVLRDYVASQIPRVTLQSQLRYPDLAPMDDEDVAQEPAQEEAARQVVFPVGDNDIDDVPQGKDDDSQLSVEAYEELVELKAVDVEAVDNMVEETISTRQYIERFFVTRHVGNADRLCPRDDAYYTSDKIDFRKSTLEFLNTLHESEHVVFRLSADVDSTSVFCSLSDIHAWPRASLTGSQFFLNKGPTPWRRLSRTTMMNVRVSSSSRVPPRPLHAIPHCLIGTLNSDVGTFQVYFVSTEFDSEKDLVTTFYSVLKWCVLHASSDVVPPDFRAAVATASFGSAENKGSHLRVDAFVMKEVMID
jgi:hypothetical protein